MACDYRSADLDDIEPNQYVPSLHIKKKKKPYR